MTTFGTRYSWIAVGPRRGPLGESARWPELSSRYTTKIFRHTPGPSGTTRDGTLHFSDRISWPITPFVGTIGVAPEREVTTSLDGQGEWGGNLDIRDVAPGNRIHLPVFHAGGRFYLDGLYLINGRNASGPLSEDFVRQHMHSRGMRGAFTVTPTFSDTSIGFGNTGTSVFLPQVTVNGVVGRDSMYVRQVFHRWVSVCTITNAAVGDYYLQVRTNHSPSTPLVFNSSVNTGGHNRFSIRVDGATLSVFGNGKLPLYVNSNSTTTPTFSCRLPRAFSVFSLMAPTFRPTSDSREAASGPARARASPRGSSPASRAAR